MSSSSEIALSVARQFSINGIPLSAIPFGNGHIHKTYLVKTNTPGVSGYILQKINHNIFKQVPELCLNISKITKFMHSGLELLQTRFGSFHYKDDDGGYWRMFNYIPDSRVYERTSDLRLANEAGRAVGSFQHQLAGFSEELTVILPHFHDLKRREKELDQAILNDNAKRLNTSRELILEYKKHSAFLNEYESQLKDVSVPIRITHNDTKLNNILFDNKGNHICLIDLDTVMPGYAAYDYGDALRTLANNAIEDATNINEVSFNMEICRAFTKGYLSKAKAFLTAKEIRLLPEAPGLMTYIIGIRFLTDYLNGDTYYYTRYEKHNLIRARVQLTLLNQIMDNLEQIRSYAE
ncbi:MAG: phosphotransferase [Bacteroidetes bacterium]|nr:phosphotransferase [Bacteroidota bacterium]